MQALQHLTTDITTMNETAMTPVVQRPLRTPDPIQTKVRQIKVDEIDNRPIDRKTNEIFRPVFDNGLWKFKLRNIGHT